MNPVKYLTLLLALATNAAIGGERVQATDAHWKTIGTAHYRIHYPANPNGGFEPFALEVASKIEGIHATVAEKVGFEAKGPTDVLIQDPAMEANGMAVPLSKRPIVVLWKTPPERDSGIGHHGNWVDMVLTHELVHLHHMMRPQNARNPVGKLLDLPPVGPITTKAPRLVLEGYATMLEGRITGTGRPHSAYRAAVIRQWALQGKLPDYYEASSEGGFRGGSMAYLLGSAYLEWLERQNPDEPDILQKFWKQLASKRRRGYDESFRATFGTSPEDSYDRWRAEVTHDAIAQERNAKAAGIIREGTVVARFDGEVTDLALSPDGTKLMAGVMSRKKPGIRIWDLKAVPEPEKGKRKSRPSQEKPDPNEVEDRKPDFVEPKVLATIGRRDGRMPRRAWWTGDFEIAFELRVPNAEGVLEPKFFTMDTTTKKTARAPKSFVPPPTDNPEYNWKDVGGVWNIVKTDPEGGGRQQLTRTLSSAWQPAPSPDGKSLYYVQLTATGCEVRVLDLTQPGLEPADLFRPETMMVQDTILSPPDTPGLLPPPSDAPINPKDYSVWDTHRPGLVMGEQFGPSGNTVQIGVGGSDILGRLNWYALGSLGSASGPRGAGFGAAYRGWRLSPSLQAFDVMEKPSAQRFVPAHGYDRERTGAELALTWGSQGMTRFFNRLSGSWESVKALNPEDRDGGKADRWTVGLVWGFSTIAGRGDWTLRAGASLQEAAGSTDFGHQDDSFAWSLTRLKADLRLYTPAGPLTLTAEQGWLHGDPSHLDVFALGGQAFGPVPAGLQMNRLNQPALPAYTQVGNRMRQVRAEYGSLLRAYYEISAVWQSPDSPDYQRVAGLEINFDDMLGGLPAAVLGAFPSISLGLHRTLDGGMKGRTVFTMNVSVRL